MCRTSCNFLVGKQSYGPMALPCVCKLFSHLIGVELGPRGHGVCLHFNMIVRCVKTSVEKVHIHCKPQLCSPISVLNYRDHQHAGKLLLQALDGFDEMVVVVG